MHVGVKKKKFRDERVKEEEKLDKEVKEEWEKRLKAIQIQYEADLKRKLEKEAKVIQGALVERGETMSKVDLFGRCSTRRIGR